MLRDFYLPVSFSFIPRPFPFSIFAFRKPPATFLVLRILIYGFIQWLSFVTKLGSTVQAGKNMLRPTKINFSSFSPHIYLPFSFFFCLAPPIPLTNSYQITS